MTTQIDVLANGELIKSDPIIPTGSDAISNEPVDRSKVDAKTKKELAKLLKKLPEIKPVLNILIGKAETKKLIKD